MSDPTANPLPTEPTPPAAEAPAEPSGGPPGQAPPAQVAAATGGAIGTVIATVAAALLLLVPAVAAFAQQVSGGVVGSDLTGATGQATSLDNGAVVSRVTAPGSVGASPEHPFLVARSGRVTWSGSTPAVITDHHWTVSVYALPVKSGGSANPGHKTSASGTEKVGDYLKVPMVGLYRVNGSLTGNGGSVSGAVWIKVKGSPTGTPIWFFGLFCVLGGAVLAAFSRPTVAT